MTQVSERFGKSCKYRLLVLPGNLDIKSSEDSFKGLYIDLCGFAYMKSKNTRQSRRQISLSPKYVIGGV
jgi:hypothetical protein